MSRSAGCGTFALVAVAIAAGGCGKTHAGPDASASVDAAAAKPLVYGGPLDARVVARTRSWTTRLVALPDGRTILDSGIFVHAITPDGGLRMVGDAAAYSVLRSADENLAGYDVSRYPQSRSFTVVEGRVVLASSSDDGTPLSLASDGKTWAPATAPPPETPKPTIQLPPGIVGVEWTLAADGRHIALGRRSPDGEPVTAIARPGSRDAALVSIDLARDATGRVLCDHVPSRSTPHLLCRVYETRSKQWVHRLEGDRWKVVTGGGLDADNPPEKLDAAAVGDDGTLWFALGDGKVTRLMNDGRATTFDMPTPDRSLARASYSSHEEIALSHRDDSTFKRWEFVAVLPEDVPGPVEHVEQIVPQRDGEAWVFARERGAGVLVHLRKPSGDIGALPEPIAIGSETDQRVEIHNTKPARQWVGHCPQIFVTLGKRRADGTSSADRVWSLEKDIASVVKKAAGKERNGASVALAQGRLGERSVGGVLVWRPLPDSREDLVEKIASALADRFAENPATPAEITCTVPVLERAKSL